MLLSIFRSTLLVSCLMLLLPAGARADKPQAVSTAKLLMQVFHTIVEHHIEAPTRQQLVLDTIRHVAQQKGQVPAPDLSSRISSADPEQLESLLARELSRYLDAIALQRDAASQTRSIAEFLNSRNILITSKEDYRIQQQFSANRYVGIGVTAGMYKPTQQLQIIQVVKGGTAERAGALDGDIVDTVDGQSTKDKSITEVIDWLRGEEGTDVVVELRQPNEDKIRKYTMTRDVVPFATVNEPDYSHNHRVVAIGFKNFSGSTVHELRKIEAGLPDSVEVVTLDFRNQAGTNLQHGILLANALLDEKPIGKVESTTGIRLVTAEPGTLFGDRKLLIVINQRTGGTPLWIATAVKDNSEEQIVFGQSDTSSFVQDAVPLEGTDFVIDMPTQRLLRSNGKSMQYFDPYGIRFSSRIARLPEVKLAQRRDTPMFVSPNPAHTDHFDQIPFNELANAVSRKLIPPSTSDEPKE